MDSFRGKLLISIILSITIALCSKFIFKFHINKNVLLNKELISIGTYKNTDLFIFYGDIVFPNDIDKRSNYLSLDPTRVVYDAFVISSVLTNNGEEWTRLPASVGKNISIVDKSLFEQYKAQILEGISWQNNPNISIKEFQIGKNYDYRKLTHIKAIYAISIYNALMKIASSKKHKEKLSEGIEFSVKDIIEKYSSRDKNVSRICFPAISGVMGTIDDYYYLDYEESWSAIFQGISRSNLTGINHIYFVLWEGLDDKERNLAIKCFIEAYSKFLGRYFKSFFYGCLFTYALSFMFYNWKDLSGYSFLKVIGTPIALFPAAFTIFGIINSELFSKNILSFTNYYYYPSAIICNILFFFCGAYNYIFVEIDEKNKNRAT